MHQYLLWHDYWSYVDGANDATPEATHKDSSAWEQAASRVMYYFASSVTDQLLSHIRDVKTPKESWENLKKIFATSTTTQRLQLRQELNNIWQRNMSITYYTTKVKEICEALGLINVTVDEDVMVHICLGCLAQRYEPIRTAPYSQC